MILSEKHGLKFLERLLLVLFDWFRFQWLFNVNCWDLEKGDRDR